jgi:hypothetical protein
MMRGNISNIGKPIFWVMREVLFDTKGDLRADRVDWLDKVLYAIEIVVILAPNEQISDHAYYVEYKTFRSLRDAQRALKQDPRPTAIISENVDSLEDETWAFSENILFRYNISMR